MKKGKKPEEKTLEDILVDTAVEKYKKGEITSGKEVQDFLSSMMQPILQKMLDAELENHLEYSKYEHTNKDNSRNGYCKSKLVKTECGMVRLKTPRDRKGTFEPVIVEKGQTKLEGFEEKCVTLYAKGISTRDISNIIKEFYGVNISKDEVTRLVGAINDEVSRWQNRPLKPLYVFAYADCLYVPIKDNLKSEKKAVYVIVGVDAYGYKDILGVWIDKSESASFWTNVFENLKSRGVKDILFMVSDGVAGFKESLDTVFPITQAQRCVVHLTRNLHKLCSRSIAKEVVAGFKTIYTSSSLDEAALGLEAFKEKFEKNSTIVKKVEDFMQYLEPLYELPKEIRKAIYTSNVVESVNSALRKVTKGKGSFPSEESVIKVMYLRIKDLKEKWSRPIQNWKIIQEQLVELFGERYTQYLEYGVSIDI